MSHHLSSRIWRFGLLVVLAATVSFSSPLLAAEGLADDQKLQKLLPRGGPIRGAELVFIQEEVSSPYGNTVMHLEYNQLVTPGGVIFHVTPNTVENLRTVFVPESTIQLYLWKEKTTDGGAQAFYAISYDGDQIQGRVRATTYRIRLQGVAFDPLDGVQAVDSLLAAQPHNTLHFVQFVTTPLPEFRQAVARLGGKIHRFLTDHTFIVEMSQSTRAQVAELPFVRWIGPYHPAYRLEGILRSILANPNQPLEPQRYSILVCERNERIQEALAAYIQGLGGIVHFTTPKGYRLEATLTREQLLEVVHANEVQFIDRWGGPGETDMNIVRQVGGADYIESLHGWTGQGVRGEIFDTELRTTHQEWLYSPIIHSSGTTGSYHGTSCFSINFAQGVNSSARGMLPDGQGIYFRYNESTQFGGSKSRYDINQELIDPTGPYRAVFQTSSVGSSRTTQYTTISAEVDDYLFLYPVLSTQSQSNAGDQMSRPQAWAKNIVACGGLYHYGTADRSDDRWNYGASIGPASDGRVKPDLAYFYDSISAAYGSSNTSYTSFGGTSAATPETAGHFGMLFQMWHEQVWQGYGGGGSVFESRPEMATAKALMCNTAYRYDWTAGGPNGDINRNVQGWGTADLGKLYDRAALTVIVNETDLITPLATNSYTANVAAGESEFNVTLAYTDPMGTVGAAYQRINDLSLRVTSPSSTVYWGNNGLRSGNVSTPGGSSNTIDTVENVFIQNPASGIWTVEVIADELVQDSHTETPTLDADYALVINGGLLGPPDTTPPNPDPMTWATTPYATGSTSIAMVATTATDPSGVEYYFTAVTAGGHDSGWQDSTTYEDTGLTPNTTYTYTVKARDKSPNQNETAASSQESATTDPQQGWVELTYDDFEGGWGNFVDGGRDCKLHTKGKYSHQGKGCADIQDNSGTSSSFYYGSGVDVHNPGYTEIKIEFWFKAISMDNSNEDFWVQYYDGSNWHTVAVYRKGIEFQNGVFYFETVTINESSYNFPTNMKIRFMCDASGNRDDVYIDEIRVSAQ